MSPPTIAEIPALQTQPHLPTHPFTYRDLREVIDAISQQRDDCYEVCTELRYHLRRRHCLRHSVESILYENELWSLTNALEELQALYHHGVGVPLGFFGGEDGPEREVLESGEPEEIEASQTSSDSDDGGGHTPTNNTDSSTSRCCRTPVLRRVTGDRESFPPGPALSITP